MSLIKNVPTFLWLLVAYVFARYAVVDLDMPSLDMNHIIWARDELFFLTTKDIFLIIGVICLYIEIYKAATGGEETVPETIISFMVAVGHLTIFLIWDKAHNATFFIIMLMSFLDAIGGFVISNYAARKDISVG
jgi:hypothetical protein